MLEEGEQIHDDGYFLYEREYGWKLMTSDCGMVTQDEAEGLWRLLLGVNQTAARHSRQKDPGEKDPRRIFCCVCAVCARTVER